MADELSLTPREEEVLAAIRGGALSYRHLGKVLECSDRTVEAHVRSIATKLETKAPAFVAVVAYANRKPRESDLGGFPNSAG